jgi:iron(III) transport system substrate-binding protein
MPEPSIPLTPGFSRVSKRASRREPFQRFFNQAAKPLKRLQTSIAAGTGLKPGVHGKCLAGSGLVLLVLMSLIANGCGRHRQQAIVIYTSQDQQFAEPILKDFEKQTGIRVRAVFDSEAVKTVGLANRLLAEANHPQCDVWWSNESLRTQQLARRGVLDTNTLAQFGFRSRRIVINTNVLSPAAATRSLLELTNALWRGKVALAYPMFGTTSAQFIALRRHWGMAGWERWCRALAANKPFLVDGNSVVVKLVGRGEATVGLTDFDDIEAGRREGLPVAALPLSEESVVIPNSAAVVRNAPHPAEARKLVEFLQSDAVIARLISVSALEGKAPDSGPHVRVDWSSLPDDLEPAADFLRATFLR